MNSDDFIEYLYVTGQLDENFGLKNIVRCPECASELFIYEENILYCPSCDALVEYNLNEKISNKKLSYIDKQRIKDSRK